MSVKVDALSNLATGNREEHGTPPTVASSPEIVQCQGCLDYVLSLNKQQLVCHQILHTKHCSISRCGKQAQLADEMGDAQLCLRRMVVVKF